MDPNRRRAAGELVAGLLTGIVFLVFENLLHLKIPYLVACTILWTAYVARRWRKEPAVAREWGLRRDTLKAATALCGAFFVAALAAMIAYRLIAGWRPLPAASIIVFAIYPAWSLIQQFVLQALVTANLERLSLPRAAIVPVAAALFGLAHFPDWPLMGLCAGAGLAWTFIFLRARNLVPLAFTHAWLGTLVYYWVLERDPWLEMFPR